MQAVIFVWQEVEVVDPDGIAERRKAMVPLPRYGNVCARQFEVNEEYPLVVLEARSRASHNQFFAAVSDGFNNLPEDLALLADRLNLKTIPPRGWTDPEHLRKWALCETGWCDIGDFHFETKQEATRLATFYRRHDSYAQITVVGGTRVIIKTAKSQSAAAMAKRPFEESKRAVLDLIESMVKVAQGELMRQAGRNG